MGTLRWGSETVPPRPVSVWPFRGSAPPAHWGVCLTPVPSGDTGRAAVQLLCRLWISLAPATPFLELIFAGRRGRDQALPEPGAAPLIPWRALSYCVPGGVPSPAGALKVLNMFQRTEMWLMVTSTLCRTLGGPVLVLGGGWPVPPRWPSRAVLARAGACHHHCHHSALHTTIPLLRQAGGKGPVKTEHRRKA